VDPRNLTALVRWHIAMITGIGATRATTLEVLTRIRWHLRGEGQKNYDMVVREYTQAVETYPNNADVRYALGQIHQQAGYFDRALDAYQYAIRDSSYEVIARLSSAYCLLVQGKPEAAIQQLEQALQLVRSGERSSIDPAEWAARPREEGEEHQAPEVEISLLLAKAYGRVGKQEQMEAILRQLKQTTPQRDEVSTALAEISARQGNIDSALEEYLELVRSYREKRQLDNALSVLKEMIRLDPQDPRAHAELGEIYIVRGHLEEGISELGLLVDIYLRRNLFEEAGDTLCRIGDIYAETGDSDKAFMNFRRATELKPNDMDLLREVVGYCCQIGRVHEASQYQSIIARHYFETNQVKESVAALQQLIALDRTNYEAYDMLGQTYQSVGEYEQASRVYKNLAKANPDGTVAKERLATLQQLREQSASYVE
jgi:tetratricopeptide (TPR) repeat protein